METEEKKIYTIEDIARELGVSKTTDMAITVNQIAEQCGVSRTTVLRALKK